MPGQLDTAAARVLSANATGVDRQGRFPTESIDELRRLRLMGAAAPAAAGGLELNPAQLATVATSIARQCGATAMIWAMSQLQLACLTGFGGPTHHAYLHTACREQHLIASVTSEVTTGGQLRRSDAAATIDTDTDIAVTFTKDATTVSYGAQADSLLVTLRSTATADPTDQVLVLARQDQYTLTPTGTWDTLGMRGTCSPPFQLTGRVPTDQVLPAPFADIAAACMVPLSHLLWAAVWLGIAEDAFTRANTAATGRARRAAALTTPPTGDPRLAQTHTDLQTLRSVVTGFGDRYTRAGPATRSGAAMAVDANTVKLAASDLALRVVLGALDVCGIAGYRETGELSVTRQLRDICSARLMISNHTLLTVNSELLMLTRRQS
jgi:acyl-CoA dehydrogenase